jgi:Flp pilus assembly protein TadB
MDAGAPIRDAVGAVASAVPDPARSELLTVHRLMDLGAPIDQAWAASAAPLRPIALALRRSEESGAAVGHVLSSAALDMRRDVRAEVESTARATGVRVVAPLALCFLPAYLLVGVVPVIASLAAELTIGWGN